MSQGRQNAQVPSTEKEKIIGHYIVGQNIGEGTFGKVKLGTHIETREKVAIKILEKEKITEQADVERVSREIHILKILRHPNIIQLYEIIETQKQLYLIMEYAQGGELFDYIVKNQKINEKESCKYIQQILSGVEYLHNLNIAHRDLKPENLLLDHQKNLKIVDFGLSNIYKQGELLKTACGSPCYAAPEMIQGKKYEGLCVDVWSTGIIMFALICGYLPFEDQNTSVLYKKIVSGEFTIPKFVSNEAKDLMKCILNTDPTKRYKINDIRSHTWYLLHKQNLNQGIYVGKQLIPVNETILMRLKDYNIDLDHAKKCIENNKHNEITTTYYLLLNKYIQSGGNLEDLQPKQQQNISAVVSARSPSVPAPNQAVAGVNYSTNNHQNSQNQYQQQISQQNQQTNLHNQVITQQNTTNNQNQQQLVQITATPNYDYQIHQSQEQIEAMKKLQQQQQYQQQQQQQKTLYDQQQQMLVEQQQQKLYEQQQQEQQKAQENQKIQQELQQKWAIEQQEKQKQHTRQQEEEQLRQKMIQQQQQKEMEELQRRQKQKEEEEMIRQQSLKQKHEQEEQARIQKYKEDQMRQQILIEEEQQKAKAEEFKRQTLIQEEEQRVKKLKEEQQQFLVRKQKQDEEYEQVAKQQQYLAQQQAIIAQQYLQQKQQILLNQQNPQITNSTPSQKIQSQQQPGLNQQQKNSADGYQQIYQGNNPHSDSLSPSSKPHYPQYQQNNIHQNPQQQITTKQKQFEDRQINDYGNNVNNVNHNNVRSSAAPSNQNDSLADENAQVPAIYNLDEFDNRSNNSSSVAGAGRKSISDNTPTPKKFDLAHQNLRQSIDNQQKQSKKNSVSESQDFKYIYREQREDHYTANLPKKSLDLTSSLRNSVQYNNFIGNDENPRPYDHSVNPQPTPQQPNQNWNGNNQDNQNMMTSSQHKYYKELNIVNQLLRESQQGLPQNIRDQSLSQDSELKSSTHNHGNYQNYAHQHQGQMLINSTVPKNTVTINSHSTNNNSYPYQLNNGTNGAGPQQTIGASPVGSSTNNSQSSKQNNNQFSNNQNVRGSNIDNKFSSPRQSVDGALKILSNKRDDNLSQSVNQSLTATNTPNSMNKKLKSNINPLSITTSSSKQPSAKQSPSPRSKSKLQQQQQFQQQSQMHSSTHNYQNGESTISHTHSTLPSQNVKQTNKNQSNGQSNTSQIYSGNSVQNYSNNANTIGQSKLISNQYSQKPTSQSSSINSTQNNINQNTINQPPSNTQISNGSSVQTKYSTKNDISESLATEPNYTNKNIQQSSQSSNTQYQNANFNNGVASSKEKIYTHSMTKSNAMSPRIATENNDPHYRQQVYQNNISNTSSSKSYMNTSKISPSTTSAASYSKQYTIQSGIKVHRGPFNLRAVTNKDPKYTVSEIIKTLESFKMYYKPTSRFDVRVEKDLVKFDISVNILHNVDNLYLIKFTRIIGDTHKYNEICNNILNQVQSSPNHETSSQAFR